MIASLRLSVDLTGQGGLTSLSFHPGSQCSFGRITYVSSLSSDWRYVWIASEQDTECPGKQPQKREVFRAMSPVGVPVSSKKTSPPKIGDTLEVPLGKQGLDHEICKFTRADAGCIDL